MNPIEIAYSLSHEDHEDNGVRGRRDLRDDPSDFKIEAFEFDGNFKLKNYLDWVRAIKRIFELKEYNDGKTFKLAILKMKGYYFLSSYGLS